MTSSDGYIFRVTGPLCGEFTGPGEFLTQRPVTWSFNVFFDLRLNKRLSKQPWGWWFETPSWSLWRQCNGNTHHYTAGISLYMGPANERCLSLAGHTHKMIPVTGQIFAHKCYCNAKFYWLLHYNSSHYDYSKMSLSLCWRYKWKITQEMVPALQFYIVGSWNAATFMATGGILQTTNRWNRIFAPLKAEAWKHFNPP